LEFKQGSKPLIIMRFKAILIFVMLIGFFSCSTEKNKFFNRSYHNTTARYNGYFNAGELIKESLQDFHIQNKDDYTKILPVFIIPDEERSKSLFAPMDKAIMKTSTVIRKHSMPNPEKKANKNEEWCKWIDNNWMVMGMSYFYKRDFLEARTRFEYVFKQYQAESIKYDAWLWEAKTFMELGDFVNAQTYLDKLQDKFEEQTDKIKIAEKKKKDAKAKSSRSKSKSKSKSKTPNLNPDMSSKLYDDIHLTWADFYLRKKDYAKAELKLVKSLEYCKNKKQRARIHFILGQLYQIKGDRSRANMEYALVDKLNPEYEMEFYSRIFRALNYDGGNSAGLKRQLLKMAKDDKNKDYLDQIYYALAEIELQENNEPDGVAYLKKSVKFSTTNNRQKGLSFKRLGDLYYGKKKFINAKTYYDSTMSNLPTTYEKYAEVKEKAESLKDLVVNLLVIQREDSLQRLGAMPEKELEKFVDDLIAKQDAEAERKRQKELNDADKAPVLNVATAGGSSWYFYNPTTMTQGYNEFKKIWGPRKLEDNWRRSDKSTSIEFIEESDSSDIDEPVSKDDALKRRNDIIKKIPKTEKELNESRMNLVNALYKAGYIYHERLIEEALAIECFERVTSKFNTHEKALPSHFQLYIIQTNKNNTTKSDIHKDHILTNYPDSEYARIIRNPNYKKEEAYAKKADERKYEEAFTNYKQKMYENALTACNDVIDKEPKNSMLPRYYYLRALTYGELKRFEEFETALSETSSKFPKEEVGIAAAELLNKVRNRNSIVNASEGKSTYIFEPETEHFFVLVFTSNLGSVNDAKAKISNFNSADFSLDGLKITNNFLNTDDQVILVKRFDNMTKALNYYDAFMLTDMLKGLNDKATFFVITNKNYASLYVEKKVAEYKKFFDENYK
jgi:tetratricopeptide (TPR) repeat protein